MIIGKSLLFSLKLSPDWHLAPGVGHPEIVAMHERAGKKWVASGDAWYVVYHHEKRWAMELAVRIRPVSANPMAADGETVSINRHSGTLTWKHKKRGLPWNRHTVTFMNIAFECPHTDRRITLEFSGWCPPDGFNEILQALQQLGCH